MAKKKAEAKNVEKSTAAKVVKEALNIKAVQLPNTCVVILEKTSSDFGIDHKGRQSIVLGELSKATPTTFALRTGKGDVKAEKQVYAMGTGSANGEIGLVHAKSEIEAVVMIANLNKISKITVAPSKQSIDIKKALLKRVNLLGVRIEVE